MDIQKPDTRNPFACGTGDILQQGQSLSTVVYKAESDFRQEYQEQSSEEEREAQIQVQMLKSDKISGVWCEITLIGIILLQERNFVPKDDFPIHLSYCNVQRHNENQH